MARLIFRRRYSDTKAFPKSTRMRVLTPIHRLRKLVLNFLFEYCLVASVGVRGLTLEAEDASWVRKCRCHIKQIDLMCRCPRIESDLAYVRHAVYQ